MRSRAGVAAEIARDVLAIAQHRRQRGVDTVGRGALADIAQHHHRRQYHRHRIGEVLPAMSGALPCTASNIAQSRADVGARRDAESADQPGGEVRHDVAVEIRQHQAVERFRLDHQFHAQRVDHARVGFEFRIVVRHRLRRS